MVRFDSLYPGELFLYNGEVCVKIEPIQIRDPTMFTKPVNYTVNYYGLERNMYGRLGTEDEVICLHNDSKQNIVLSAGVQGI